MPRYRAPRAGESAIPALLVGSAAAVVILALCLVLFLRPEEDRAREKQEQELKRTLEEADRLTKPKR